MEPVPVCLCFLTRTGADGGREVLLGRKRRGFGTGRILGLGGHLEPGETALDAAVRETAEECGIAVAPTDLREVAEVVFRFPERPEWDLSVAVFLGENVTGEVRECDEIEPLWFPADALPFDEMWEDNRYWLPRVLAGEVLRAEFVYTADDKTVAAQRIEPLARIGGTTAADSQDRCGPDLSATALSL